ncbi:alpha/beta hydrolase [Aquabacterium sp.]|uniref:alpha/beta hydrolase n=1 Tax=Aquabacterium sp. TaxID=1872578 RepID=UPI002D7FE8D3|nr:alpha/beta fold hydrolase [Aquabacterium sp.]
MLLTTGLTLLLGYAVVCGLMWLNQRGMIYFPTPARPAHGTQPTLQVLDAVLRLAVHAQPGSPRALIYFGGNAEDVSGSLPDLAEAFPAHAIYALHYRGYSGSTGTPTETALHADALALYDQVQRSHARITLVGRSLGSGVAVRLAARRPVEQLVLVTPFDSLQRVAQQAYPWLPVRWLLRDTYESWRHAPQVTAPTRLILAGHDEVIPPAHGLALAGHFRPGIASVHTVAEAGHNDISAFAGYAALLNGSR